MGLVDQVIEFLQGLLVLGILSATGILFLGGVIFALVFLLKRTVSASKLLLKKAGGDALVRKLSTIRGDRTDLLSDYRRSKKSSLFRNFTYLRNKYFRREALEREFFLNITSIFIEHDSELPLSEPKLHIVNDAFKDTYSKSKVGEEPLTKKANELVLDNYSYVYEFLKEVRYAVSGNKDVKPTYYSISRYGAANLSGHRADIAAAILAYVNAGLYSDRIVFDPSYNLDALFLDGKKDEAIEIVSKVFEALFYSTERGQKSLAVAMENIRDQVTEVANADYIAGLSEDLATTEAGEVAEGKSGLAESESSPKKERRPLYVPKDNPYNNYFEVPTVLTEKNIFAELYYGEEKQRGEFSAELTDYELDTIKLHQVLAKHLLNENSAANAYNLAEEARIIVKSIEHPTTKRYGLVSAKKGDNAVKSGILVPYEASVYLNKILREYLSSDVTANELREIYEDICEVMREINGKILSNRYKSSKKTKKVNKNSKVTKKAKVSKKAAPKKVAKKTKSAPKAKRASKGNLPK